MPGYTQAKRLAAVTTPLGADTLLLARFRGKEAISELFEFELDLFAAIEASVPFGSLLGKTVDVRLDLEDGSKRYWNGIVRRMTEGPRAFAPRGDRPLFRTFRMTMVPKVWLATRVAQSRIFQQKSVKDILNEVLSRYDIQLKLTGTYEPRDYTVQYRESDFAFASRLMEEEGIFYFFDHKQGSHPMILADSPQSHTPIPGGPFTYAEASGGFKGDRVEQWEVSQEIRSGKITLWDTNFELIDQNLQACATTTPTTTQAGTVSHDLTAGPNAPLELYDHPGGYAKRFDGITPGGGERPADLQKIFSDNIRTAKIEARRETAQSMVVHGGGDCRRMASGFAFTLEKHFNNNGDYVLMKVEHHLDQADTYFNVSEASDRYTNTFCCIPKTLPYAPPLTTPKPRIDGTQTAKVVGPAGTEIFPDKYGRIKVQFRWDREGKFDANSSCWIRVCTSWAGQQWGAISIPRVGQEVIVAFEEGDPDQPVIVGSVYNPEMMPPYTLPDEMTKSTIKSRSTLKGTDTNFNEFRFEDKKGQEEVYLHAERDFNEVVENNHTLTVGSADTQTCPEGDQTIKIYRHRTETVETGDEKVTISKGNRTIEVTLGDDTHLVKTGKRTAQIQSDETTTVKMGNRVTNVDMGNDTLTLKMGNQTTDIKLGKGTTTALQSIELKVGASSVKIDQTGVTIKGLMIKIQGTAMTEVKAPITQVNGDGLLILKGGIVMIN